MKQLTFAVAMLAGTAFASVPVIDQSSISARQDGGRTVVIGYTMNPAVENDDGCAIITVDILTNYTENAETKWASIGGEHLATLYGDVNKVIEHTQDYKHNILWDPTKEGLPNLKFDANDVKVEISAWSTNSPPAYWVIDLTQPADRMADRYYPNAGQIPGTVTNDLYKTDRLVFRRIPAKGVTWKMGDSKTLGARVYHYVTFTHDYWMSVFETTCAQAKRMNDGTSENKTPRLGTWNNFRGSGTSYKWPDYGHDANIGGHIGAYRTALGGILVDMPTRAEWEFACRAGTSTAYNNGTDDEAGLDKVGWYTGNSGGALHDVGLKDPNNYGLYDMHGNALEWVLDWLEPNDSSYSSAPAWDPVGGDGSKNAKFRLGGYYNSTADKCKTVGHDNNSPSTSSDRCGVRLAVLLP